MDNAREKWITRGKNGRREGKMENMGGKNGKDLREKWKRPEGKMEKIGGKNGKGGRNGKDG